jgi:hypothetical protein
VELSSELSRFVRLRWVQIEENPDKGVSGIRISTDVTLENPISKPEW